MASVCVYAYCVSFLWALYRQKVLWRLGPTRMTPRYVIMMVWIMSRPIKSAVQCHFAAIAGAGPLVGPVLAAQMGYLPRMIWLLAGVIHGGSVRDFMVLFVSTRRDGRNQRLVKEEMGATAG